MDPVGLSTGHLYLRLPTAEDVPAILTTCRDPETARWTRVPVPYSSADAEQWVEASAAGWASGQELSWVLAEVTTGEYAGAIGLRLPPDGSPDVGYMTAPWARGRGLMTEALSAVAGFGFGALGLRRIELLHHLGNEASCRVAERCGFAAEGIRPRGCEQRGEVRDAEVHVRTA